MRYFVTCVTVVFSNIYTVYYEQQNSSDQRIVSMLCKCFRLFYVQNYQIRGLHRGLMRCIWFFQLLVSADHRLGTDLRITVCATSWFCGYLHSSTGFCDAGPLHGLILLFLHFAGSATKVTWYSLLVQKLNTTDWNRRTYSLFGWSNCLVSGDIGTCLVQLQQD